jgi:protease I
MRRSSAGRRSAGMEGDAAMSQRIRQRTRQCRGDASYGSGGAAPTRAPAAPSYPEALTIDRRLRMDTSQSLDGLKVAILACTGFEQVEMTEPRKALQQAGADTKLVSAARSPIQGFNHDKPADKFDVDLTFEEADPAAFDAVLLPGGVMNADMIRMNEAARQFVQAIDRADKPIAVICHGPWLLVSAGLVKGRNLTSWPSLQDDIRNAGGTWTDQEVVRDRNWVSSRKPQDIPAFNQAMTELFSQHQHAPA